MSLKSETMRKSIFLFVMMLMVFVAYPQHISGDLSVTKEDTIKKKILDHTNYIVTYRYSYVPNAEAPEKKRHGFTDLQIGDRYNMFQDYYRVREDSVFDAIVKSGGSFFDLYAAKSGYFKKRRFDERILLDRDKGKLTVIKKSVSGTYRYDEDMPVLEWKITEGDTIIAGYNCKKGITRYAGRDYIAWFTPEIDLPYGPFKFNGLPGLILSICDTRGHYSFSLYGISNNHREMPIYMPMSDDIVKSSREKVRRIYKNDCADPVRALEADGGKVTIPEDSKSGVKPKPYNPIELE